MPLSIHLKHIAASLKDCAGQKDLQAGSKIHNDILRSGFLGKDSYLNNILIDMYVKCGALEKAAQLFNEHPVRDVVSWNVLITGYAHHGYNEKVFRCFERMQQEGFSPNSVTYICVLKALGSIRTVENGQQIHAEILSRDLLGCNIKLDNALVDMYAKCGALGKAAQVFEQLPVHNVVSWNALIAGYVQYGRGDEALRCFQQMQHERFSLNAITLSSILKACSSIGAADKGEQFHKEIVRQGLLAKDVVLGNSLVDMYARCGAFADAIRALDGLPVRDVVAWNALIAGYVQHGCVEDALDCFEWMRDEGVIPDKATFISLFKACANIGAADKGRRIHDEMATFGLLGKDIILGTALVDMYAKCGALANAIQVLYELPVRDVISWSALIAGCAKYGQGNAAMSCFEQMQQEGVFPNAATMAFLLNACSRSGLLDEGQKYFASMTSKYGIRIDVEHCAYMVDLFGHAGDFDNALAMIKKMPSSDFLPVWHAILSACYEYGNLTLGKFAFDNAIAIDNCDATAYMFMANIYVAAGLQEEADEIKAMRKEMTAGEM